MIEQLIEFGKTLECYEFNAKEFIFKRKTSKEGKEFFHCMEKLLPFLDNLNIEYGIKYNMDVKLEASSITT